MVYKKIGLSLLICSVIASSVVWPIPSIAAGEPSLELTRDINSRKVGIDLDSDFVEFNGALYYNGEDGLTGSELWKTDGTEEGTELVKDIEEGPNGSSPDDLTVFGDYLYFVVDREDAGYEIWRTDGTEEGTELFASEGVVYDPSGFTVLSSGTEMVFRSYTEDEGEELWVTDGTLDGTSLLVDIRSGGSGSSPEYLFESNNIVYFSANDGVNGQELWVTDGTASGTTMLVNINPGGSSSSPEDFMADASGTVYFTAYTNSQGRELWKTDGTPEGTAQAIDIDESSSQSTNPGSLTVFNGRLYFSADIDDRDQVWYTDGTASGTAMLATTTVEYRNIEEMVVLNGNLYFQAYSNDHGQELFWSDGEVVELFWDIDSGADEWDNPYASNPSDFIVFNNYLYFSAFHSEEGRDLWRTNGQMEDPEDNILERIDNIAPDERSSYPSSLTVLGDELIFVARSIDSYQAIWKTDGSTAVAELAADPSVPTEDAYGELSPRYAQLGDALFYVAFNPEYGVELWRMTWEEGSPDVEFVYDIDDRYDVQDDDPENGSPYALTAFDGYVYFEAEDAEHGEELWRSNGETTELFLDVYPGTDEGGYPNASSPSDLIVLGDYLYFTAYTLDEGRELWRTDGVITELVSDIYEGDNGSYPTNFVILDGVLYFTANDGVNDVELWKTNGTEEGTVMVKDINPEGGSSIDTILVHNGKIYIAASEPETGEELWVSDGTEEGTVMLKNINPGSAEWGGYSSSPYQFTAGGDVMYFAADDGTTGTELWKTDGTEEGTVLVYDIYEGSSASYPGELFYWNGDVYFYAQDEAHGSELWKTDGTEGGTVLLKDTNEGGDSGYPDDFISYFGYLYFGAESGDNGSTLWRTDGTSEGTEEYVVANPSGYNSLYSPFDFDDHLLWVVGSELYGTEVMYLSNYDVGEEDSTPPTVESVSPSDEASDVAVDVSITVTFSEPMNTSSVVVSASPCDEVCPTPSVTAWSEDGTVATIENGSDYGFGTEYTLNISGEDENGNDMAEEFSFSFTTISAPRRSGGGGGGIRFLVNSKPKQTTTSTASGTATTTTPTTSIPVAPSVPSQPDIAIPQNGLQCSTNLILTTPVRLGATNNAADVRLLEQFLNTYEGTNLPVNGIYETVDFNAVVVWQEKHASDILTPWGLNKGTGYVYTTSLKKIKEIHEANCATAVTTPVAPTQPITPVSASCLNTETTLTQGMTGTLVATAQTLLKNLNFFSVTPTGFFGPVTTASVKAFQSANSIDSVGYIGPATRAKLNELGCR